MTLTERDEVTTSINDLIAYATSSHLNWAIDYSSKSGLYRVIIGEIRILNSSLVAGIIEAIRKI